MNKSIGALGYSFQERLSHFLFKKTSGNWFANEYLRVPAKISALITEQTFHLFFPSFAKTNKTIPKIFVIVRHYIFPTSPTQEPPKKLGKWVLTELERCARKLPSHSRSHLKRKFENRFSICPSKFIFDWNSKLFNFLFFNYASPRFRVAFANGQCLLLTNG